MQNPRLSTASSSRRESLPAGNTRRVIIIGAGVAGKASAATRPALAGYNADPALLDSWFVVNADVRLLAEGIVAQLAP